MSDVMIDEIPSSETDHIMRETGINNEEEETWLYGNNKPKIDENVDNTTAPSIDEVTTQEIDARENATISSVTIPTTTSLIGSQLDDDDSDDDDDDGIKITIGNYEPEVSTFQNARQKNRTMLTGGPVMPPKPPTTRGVDLDAQGMINGQPTYEHDLLNSYKDDEKPWKKPGTDMADYFNYGFTEETWVSYCDRQRRLRVDNNLARLNGPHIPQMQPMLPGHPGMMHPMNPHSIMMLNKPMNMQMMTRPMNIRRPDGKIDVIGATDQTSRRAMFETSNSFEHPPFMNGPSFPGNQPPNGQTIGDLATTPPANNGPPPSGGAHHIPILGAHRLQMMPLPHGMQFRPQFGHPHGPGGPQFFPHRPTAGMHGDRPPQPYFVHHRPQQPWEKNDAPPVHGFPPGNFPPQTTAPAPGGTGRIPTSRSATPENHSSRSSTPEENRPNAASAGGGGDNEKSLKDDRFTERYRDDREHHSSARRPPSSKEHSSSTYRPHHRSSEHEYERPRNDRKSSRDQDDKYERYSRKRHHKEDSTRHHRIDDESSRTHRSSHRTPTNVNPSGSTPTESSQTINDQIEASELVQSTSTSSPVNRSRHDDSDRSSSRHSHHKKSSKHSRRDSDDERNKDHHRRRSRDHSSSNSKKSTNQNEFLSDVKEQITE